METSAERLRQILPAMSQHKIPATPENYAIWYHYFIGDKQALRKRIDKLIAEDAIFTEEVNRELYELLTSSDQHLKMERIGQHLQEILESTTGSIHTTGSQAKDYGESLQRLQNTIGTSAQPNTPVDLLQAVLEETREMRASLNQMRLEFEHKTQEIDQLKRELEQVRQRAITDPLTGLANRTAFAEKLDALIIEAEEKKTPLYLIMFDIDHFKQINDTHGHVIGDKVIRFVADTLTKTIDTTSLAARYGGEEFAVLLPDSTTQEALGIANKIKKTIKEAKLVRTGTREPIGRITISGGITRHNNNESTTTLIQRADKALYKAKNSGRDRIEFIEP